MDFTYGNDDQRIKVDYKIGGGGGNGGGFGSSRFVAYGSTGAGINSGVSLSTGGLMDAGSYVNSAGQWQLFQSDYTYARSSGGSINIYNPGIFEGGIAWQGEGDPPKKYTFKAPPSAPRIQPMNIVEYIWTGGVVDGYQYTMDGEFIGKAPIMGTPPLPSFSGMNFKDLFSVFKLFKAGIKNVDDLISAAGNLEILASGAKKGFVKGDPQKIFNVLSKGGTVLKSGAVKLKDGTFIMLRNFFYYRDSYYLCE